MEEVMENHEVVIIGAGICGLATAVALHRKGIKSVVMERSESLRNVTGAAIGIRQNGWRALDQLGVAGHLRPTAVPIQRGRDIWLGEDEEKQEEFPMTGETRCLKRKDLIDTLYAALPLGTVEFGRHLDSIKLHSQTTYPILCFDDKRSIIAKVLIGCDGANSIVGDFLNLKPTKLFPLRVVRGFTSYSNGHTFAHEFVRFRKDKNLVGRIPVDDNLVHWFCTQPYVPTDARTWEDLELIRESSLESLRGYPQEIQEMIKNADAKSLTITRVRYRAPWDLLTATFRKGTVTVAGDAMHVMGPFIGQGGSAGLEDSVVLARNLSRMLSFNPVEKGRKVVAQKVGEALDRFVKERRMRIVQLSTLTYLVGSILISSSRLMKFMYISLMVILFHDHTNYDCGVL